MTQDTIKNYLKHLDASLFNRVSMLVLRRMHNGVALNVDGVGDGGRDVIFWSDVNGVSSAAQLTVQEKNWERKIADDLDKANKASHIDVYYIFVRHEVTEKTKNKLSYELVRRHHTCVQIYGAREISSFLVQENLISDFEDIIHPELSGESVIKNDELCRALYSYYTLSDDQRNLQNEVVDSTIIFVLSQTGSMTSDDISLRVVSMLQMPADSGETIQRRIDGLITRRVVVKCNDRECALSEELDVEMRMSKKNYDTAMTEFTSVCDEIISMHGGDGAGKDAEKIAVATAKCLVLQQIESAKNSLMEVRIMGITTSFQEGVGELRQMLINCGIKSDEDIDSTFDEIVGAASKSNLVQSMLSAVVYLGVRQSPHAYSSIVLKTESWRNVDVYLDSSVAIPLIGTHLYGCSNTRFSKTSKNVYERLVSLGARMLIPAVYLNECAAHLIAAGKYCYPFDDLDDLFVHSRNGFVEHYFSLKKLGKFDASFTLRKYIESISSNALVGGRDFKTQVARVESDMLDIFQDCSVQKMRFESHPNEAIKTAVSTEYAYAVSEHSGRSVWQERHDVSVLSSLQTISEENLKPQILLTWDGALIQVAQKLKHRYWTVNPAEAADLIQGSVKFAAAEYLALTSALAQVRGRKDELAGQIVDHIVKLCKEKLTNAAYRKQLLAIKDEVLDRSKGVGYVEIMDELDTRLFEYDPDLNDGSSSSRDAVQFVN